MNPILDFKLSAFVDVVNELVRSDEIERALWVLNNLPAYYRDHEPSVITNLRNEILMRIATPGDYKNHDSSPYIEDLERARETLRFQLIRADVKYFNDKNKTPHLIDYGPGDFWLPIFLKREGLRFTYQPIFLCDLAFEKTKHLFEDTIAKEKPFNQPSMFIACEIIEHLHNEHELKTEMLKAYGKCDIIHVSTPKYSFDYQCLEWRKRDILGHLRAYTPREFFEKVQAIFPEYDDFMYYDSVVLHARGFSKATDVERFHVNLKAAGE